MTLLIARPAAAATLKPLYAQVRDLMLACVRAGEWGAGDTLPNEFALSARYEVSIGTVRRAVSELESMGVLVRKQGRGTFVAGRGFSGVQERFCRLRRRGGERLSPAYTLQSLELRPASAIERERLRANALGGVYEVVQTLTHGGLTVGIESSALPAALLPRLETQLRFGQDLYGVLADYGCLVTRIEETIGIDIATPEAAALLGAEPGDTVLSVTRTAIALDDAPVEWRTGCYLAAHVSYASG